MFAKEYETEGVELVDAFGTKYPQAFASPSVEYDALVNRVVLIDLCHWGVIRLTGGDRVRFLNSMVTNDVTRLSPGTGCHAALTTVKGKLVADLAVLAREEELLVLVMQGVVDDVAAALDKHIIADDVTLENLSAEYGVLGVEGPKSRDLAWRLFPDGPLPMEPLAFGDAEYQGTPVTVLRHSVTGEKGMHFIVHRDGIAKIHDYLVQAGRGMDMERLGRAAWNVRRVENGIPWWDDDITDNFPKESRLDDVVNYEKGCYLGQETLARMHHRGHPNWLLVGLAPSSTGAAVTDPSSLAGTELFAAGESSSDGAKSRGRLTSPVHSPARDGMLSLGYVRHEFADAGSQFEFLSDGNPVALEVVPLPIESKER